MGNIKENIADFVGEAWELVSGIVILIGLCFALFKFSITKKPQKLLKAGLSSLIPTSISIIGEWGILGFILVVIISCIVLAWLKGYI